jgi:hypothetical protein
MSQGMILLITMETGVLADDVGLNGDESWWTICWSCWITCLLPGSEQASLGSLTSLRPMYPDSDPMGLDFVSK